MSFDLQLLITPLVFSNFPQQLNIQGGLIIRHLCLNIKLLKCVLFKYCVIQ
jgi:hypothetical protein